MTALALNRPLRRVRLYGKLGARFGRVHYFALETNSVAEAVQALSAQFKGFAEYMIGSKDRGVGYAVFAGKQNLREDQLKHPVGSEDIRIAPVILGSKSGGILNIILGIILVVVGIYTDQPEIIVEGAVMIVGGVVQMLSPHPKGKSAQDSAANTPSYAFNGPVNTEAQGHPVPLLLGGPLKVGSAVISGGISVVDHSTAALPISGSDSMGDGGDMMRRTEVP